MPEALLADLSDLAEGARTTAWIVGGFVRDRLLGREPVDIDLLVEGDPSPFLTSLARKARFTPVIFSRVEPVTWRVAMGDWLIDVTSCPPGGLREAMARRDFTINALAEPLGADPANVEPVDVTGGIADLTARRLRHTSVEALDADPLRLLRAIRLAVILEGFDLEAGLEEAIRARAAQITRPAAERVLQELEIILASPRAALGLRMMQRTGLLFHLFPELKPLEGLAQNRWHRLDAFEHTLASVQEADTLQAGCERIGLPDRLSPEESELLKWAALYHDTGKAETARRGADGEVHFHGHETVSASLAQRALSRLRASNRKMERIRVLIENHLRLLLLADGTATPRALRRLVHQIGFDTPLLCLLAVADRRAGGGPDFERRVGALESLAAEIVRLLRTEGDAVISPAPLLSGQDVMKILNLSPGPLVGSVLRHLSRLQVEGRLTRREDAISLLRSMPPARLRTLDDES
jgi:putative nucleotidyltransferase with HDIG domain